MVLGSSPDIKTSSLYILSCILQYETNNKQINTCQCCH